MKLKVQTPLRTQAPEFLGYLTAEFGTSLIFAPYTRGTRIISNLSTFTKRNGGHGTQKFLAKPQYATFQKIALKIAHFYCRTMSWEAWVASLRRRRTVRYFFSFAMLRASFSFGVCPLESRSLPRCALEPPQGLCNLGFCERFLSECEHFVWEIEILGSKKFCPWIFFGYANWTHPIVQSMERCHIFPLERWKDGNRKNAKHPERWNDG